MCWGLYQLPVCDSQMACKYNTFLVRFMLPWIVCMTNWLFEDLVCMMIPQMTVINIYNFYCFIGVLMATIPLKHSSHQASDCATRGWTHYSKMIFILRIAWVLLWRVAMWGIFQHVARISRALVIITGGNCLSIPACPCEHTHDVVWGFFLSPWSKPHTL